MGHSPTKIGQVKRGPTLNGTVIRIILRLLSQFLQIAVAERISYITPLELQSKIFLVKVI
jgi:hypothetical protein